MKPIAQTMYSAILQDKDYPYVQWISTVVMGATPEEVRQRCVVCYPEDGPTTVLRIAKIEMRELAPENVAA